MTHTEITYINGFAFRAVFEKSATELKQQKLLKCKQTNK